jgi:ribosomal protein S18 acetylase RimI-like enzyme
MHNCVLLAVDKHKQQRNVELIYLDTAVGNAANRDHDSLHVMSTGYVLLSAAVEMYRGVVLAQL